MALARCSQCRTRIGFGCTTSKEKCREDSCPQRQSAKARLASFVALLGVKHRGPAHRAATNQQPARSVPYFRQTVPCWLPRIQLRFRTWRTGSDRLPLCQFASDRPHGSPSSPVPPACAGPPKRRPAGSPATPSGAATASPRGLQRPASGGRVCAALHRQARVHWVEQRSKRFRRYGGSIHRVFRGGLPQSPG